MYCPSRPCTSNRPSRFRKSCAALQGTLFLRLSLLYSYSPETSRFWALATLPPGTSAQPTIPTSTNFFTPWPASFSPPRYDSEFSLSLNRSSGANCKPFHPVRTHKKQRAYGCMNRYPEGLREHSFIILARSGTVLPYQSKRTTRSRYSSAGIES